MAMDKDEKSGDGHRVPRVSPCRGRGFVILPWQRVDVHNFSLDFLLPENQVSPMITGIVVLYFISEWSYSKNVS